MLVLRKLKSYIINISNNYFLTWPRTYINKCLIGINSIISNNTKYVYMDTGYISYRIYYTIDDPTLHRTLKLTIYHKPDIARLYQFECYKKDFSDLNYIKCYILHR
jgi:hypothetical protein